MIQEVNLNPPILSEHQPVIENKKESPSDNKEKDIVQLVNDLLDKAKRKRSRYDQKWLNNYNFFRGKQWSENRPSFRHSEVINLIFSEIQSTAAILTDSRPKVEFIPIEPQDRDLAQILNQIKDYDWETNNWLSVLTEIIYDANIYGIGYGSLSFDKETTGLRFESYDPFWCYPDPASYNINDNSRYFIVARPSDIGILKQKYPDKAYLIKSDVLDIYAGSKTDFARARYKSPAADDMVLDKSSSEFDLFSNEALEITIYFRGNSIFDKLTIPEEGRKIVIINNKIITDGPLPYEDKKVPLVKLQNYILPREYYGISEIEQLESPQKIFNKLVSFTLDVLTYMGNPIWVVDDTAGIDTDNLFNIPGMVIEKNAGSEARREPGVPLQPYVLSLIDRIEHWFNNNLSSSKQVTQGLQPGSVRADSAIRFLHEAASTRLRLKSRGIDAFLQDFGQLYLSRVKQFYTIPRIFRLTNNQAVERFFKMSIEPSESMNKLILQELDTLEGQQVIKGEMKTIESNFKLDILATTGSSLPFAKAEKAQMAFSLYDRNIIDAAEVLKAIDYPNKESILDRLNQSKESQAQVEQQQLEINLQIKQTELQMKQMELQLKSDEIQGDLAIKRAKLQLNKS